MKTLTTKKRQVKASKVQQDNIVNYHYSVEQVKAQKKANDLIKPTHVSYLKPLKLILLF